MGTQGSQGDLLAGQWTQARLIDEWNGFPGGASNLLRVPGWYPVVHGRSRCGGCLVLFGMNRHLWFNKCNLREYSTVGSAYLMTDSTDRLASTVINLVLPDKVFVMACQRGWVTYSVSRCVEVKRIDSGLAFPSSRG